MLMGALEPSTTDDERISMLKSYDRCVMLLQHMHHVWAEQTADTLCSLRQRKFPSEAHQSISIPAPVDPFPQSWSNLNAALIASFQDSMSTSESDPFSSWGTTFPAFSNGG